MKQKITKQEKNWILYDVGNSAYTMLVTTIIPIYFKYIANGQGVSDVDYLAYWGYAASIVTLIVAILGPVVGTFTDNKGFKKPIFIASVAIGSICCISLGFMKYWLGFLILFIISKIGYASSLIFYDSMLPDVTEPERMDRVSTSGYAWGYIGSCIPFVACLGVVLGKDAIGLSMETAMGIAFAITAIWLVMCLNTSWTVGFEAEFWARTAATRGSIWLPMAVPRLTPVRLMPLGSESETNVAFKLSG